MADPVLAGRVITRELAARRAAQRARGQAARDDEYDRLQAEVEACQGECRAPGSTRGGVLCGDGSVTQGMVAVDDRGDPLVEAPLAGDPFVLTRPCFDCNPERWEAWQAGRLAGKKRTKPENAEDRRVREDKRRRQEQQSFD
jgi:hypothetical protein